MSEQVGCNFDFDCVVVSRVSLNKKRAKRNLQKIAHSNVPVPAAPAKRMAPTPTQQPRKVVESRPTPTPERRQVEVRAVKPVELRVQPVQPVKLQVHAPKVELQTVFSTLPDAVLANIFGDVAAAGACAVVCRDLHRTIWENDGFWHALRGSCTGTFAREAYRRWTFGLDGDWAQRFLSRASTEDPVLVLQTAARLAGGLTPCERQESDLFVEAVCIATRRAEETDQVVELVDQLGLKVAQREGPVFAPAALDRIGDAREDVLEKGILARLDAAVDADMDAAFDPFEPDTPAPAPAWVVDGPMPELVLNTPAEAPKKAKAVTRWADMDEDSDDEDMCEPDQDFFSPEGSLADDDEFLGSKKLGADFADEFLDLLR